ncbi:MAG: hypothetical protein PHE02_00010 [Lachnospiraceae bacterium]|nr:hypothetical protein [Lachnospiraceae bacterium]
MKRNIPLFITLLLSFLLRLPMMGHIESADASEYYNGIINACTNYDFKLSSFMSTFTICGHMSQGFGFFEAIGEYLAPLEVRGVLWVHMILTLMALYCIYDMFQHYWLTLNEKEAAFATLLISVIPVFLFNFPSTNPDYYMPVFFIFVIYNEYKHRYLLMLCSILVLALTKETAFALIGSYYMFEILGLFFVQPGKLSERFKRTVCDIRTILAILGGIILIIYIIFFGGSSWIDKITDQVKVARTFNYYWNTFAFQKEYFMEKTYHFWIANFMWIITITLLVSISILLIRKVRYREKRQYENIGCILGSSIFFWVSSSLYITAVLYRYVLAFSVILVIVTIVLTWRCIGGKYRRVYHLTGFFIMLLFLAQSFLSVDPITTLLYRKVDTGKWPMFAMDKNYYFRDSIMANYQYQWIDEAYDQMLSEIGYDGDTQIIRAGSERYDTIREVSTLKAWNPEKKKRQQVTDATLALVPDDIVLSSVNTTDLFGHLPYDVQDYNKYDELTQKAVVYFIPFYEENEELVLHNLSRYYYIGEKHVIEDFRGIFTYYQLTKKESYYGISVADVMEGLDAQEKPPSAIEVQKQIEELYSDDYVNRIYNQTYDFGWGYDTLKGADKEKKIVEKGYLTTGDLEISLNGQKLGYQYFNDYGRENAKLPPMEVAAGSECYRGHLDTELIGKKIGDTVEVSEVIKVDDPLLSLYAGQNLTIKYRITGIMGTYRQKSYKEDEMQEVLGKVSYIIDQQRKKIIREYYIQRVLQDDDQYTEEALSQEENAVQEYLQSYMEDNGITAQEVFSGKTDKQYDAIVSYMARTRMLMREDGVGE